MNKILLLSLFLIIITTFISILIVFYTNLIIKKLIEKYPPSLEKIKNIATIRIILAISGLILFLFIFRRVFIMISTWKDFNEDFLILFSLISCEILNISGYYFYAKLLKTEKEVLYNYGGIINGGNKKL